MLWNRKGEKEEIKIKDKTVNEEGKEMINRLEDNGLGIGNERDEDRSRRDWTLLGTKERTVIVLRIEAGKERIRRIDAGVNIKSDHLPLETDLDWKNEEEETQIEPINNDIIVIGVNRF